MVLKQMTSEQIRQKFLDFFKKKGHIIVPSSSLLSDDSSVLLTTAGMQQMVPYLLGKKHPLGKRIADSQKCFRSQDIEEVGDNRHTTFFEMLGNWSFGDYFKKEQIQWIFDFLVNEIDLNPKNFYVTVFRGNDSLNIPRDDESVKIWQEVFFKNGIDAKAVDYSEQNGMRGGRIFYYDETKNWWSRAGIPDSMPIGEIGGPNSEMFWDFGAELKIHENSQFKNSVCHVNCNCGRFLEFGNNVFIEYIKTRNGFDLLPNKNIDFGAGLERITAIKNNALDIFETDLFKPLILKIEKISPGLKKRILRILADHLRASAFLIADGVRPSNKESGYILRRLLRRILAYQVKYDIHADLFPETVKVVKEKFEKIYPEIKNTETILKVLENEKQKFQKAIAKGIKEIEKYGKSEEITGKDAFYLYETFGLPFELIRELAPEEAIKNLSKKDFDKEFKKHQEISRLGAEKKFGGHGIAEISNSQFSISNDKLQAIKLHTATHLLHSALRKILGENVKQMGLDITPERLRFDFSHFQKMTEKEIKKVEDLVNQKIREDLEIKKQEMNLEDALRSGVLAFFREKYPEKVTVYTILNSQTNIIFSREICAGPHVERTSKLGFFKIIKEESSGAGVRRIKAILE